MAAVTEIQPSNRIQRRDGGNQPRFQLAGPRPMKRRRPVYVRLVSFFFLAHVYCFWHGPCLFWREITAPVHVFGASRGGKAQGDRLVVLLAQVPAILVVLLLLAQVSAIVSSSCSGAEVLRFQRTLIWFPASSDLVAFVFPNNSSDCFGFDSRENLHV